VFQRRTYLFIVKLFENLPTLTIIVRPLAQRPRGFENIGAAWLLHHAPLEIGRSYELVAFRPHPWWQPLLTTLSQPRFERLLVIVRLGPSSRSPCFSHHTAPIRRYIVPYSPVRCTGRNWMIDHKVKVGDSFGVLLSISVFSAPHIGPVDQTRVSLVVCAAAVNVKGRGRLGLRKQKAIQRFACEGKSRYDEYNGHEDRPP
jgi:hypothetical protein